MLGRSLGKSGSGRLGDRRMEWMPSRKPFLKKQFQECVGDGFAKDAGKLPHGEGHPEGMPAIKGMEKIYHGMF